MFPITNLTILFSDPREIRSSRGNKASFFTDVTVYSPTQATGY